MAIRRRLILATTVGSLAALGGAAGPVSAECFQFDPWPSFPDAARVADRVFIGTIVESYFEDSTDHATQFRLRVDEVLRGEVPTNIDYRDGVWSGAPLVFCPGDSFLRVRVGDVWAFAEGARLEEYPDEVLAVAIVNRRLGEIERSLMPGVERFSRSAVRNLVDLPPTDSADAPAAGRTSSNVFLALVAAAVAGLLALRRTYRRPHPPRDTPRR